MAGAYRIGKKQTEITTLQTEIQRDQVRDDKAIRINELKLNLLEKRSACIRDIKEVSDAFHTQVDLSAGDRSKLISAIQDAELIFHPDVIKGLKEIVWKSYRIPSAYRAQEAAFNRGNQQKAEQYLDKALNLETEIFDALPNLIEAMIEASRIEDID